MKLEDVRRLTGANLLWDRPGAVGDARLPDERAALFTAIWRRQARRLLDAVGWTGETTVERCFPGGASLAGSAPLDGLYAATEIVEWAWDSSCAILEAREEPAFDEAAQRLRREIAEEANPPLLVLKAAAEARKVTFLHGDELVSVGLGAGARVWLERELPPLARIEWSAVHDIPVGLVTGTNGKSTTVRLTAAIAAAAGRTPGLCSSDWVRVGDEVIAEGDYSGPGGARLALRDPRVDVAVLEVARGGLLRRGLPLPQAEACLITNVAADHFGDYGIHDLDGLAEAKFVLARAVKPGGRLILNADDPMLVERAARFEGRITWFGLSPDNPVIAAWTRDGGEACYPQSGRLVWARGAEMTPIVAVDQVPLALGGAARHNLANALGAIALAGALGLPPRAMAAGLSRFTGGASENPGRGNLFEIGGVSVLVDFAHNPHGVAALIDMLPALPAERRLILLGQAGDRSDEDIRDLARTVWAGRPERIVVKEMAEHLRGRAPGEVPRLIRDELQRLGAPPEAIGHADSELAAVRQAFDWARPGDVLVLLLHAERDTVLELLETLKTRKWRPGQVLEN
jgi:UDP-N-acetylmuramyl tripeptide synthase